MKKFSVILRQWVKDEGLKPLQAAEKLGTSKQNYYNWLSGRNEPDLVSMLHIQAVTGGKISVGSFKKTPRKPRA